MQERMDNVYSNSVMIIPAILMRVWETEGGRLGLHHSLDAQWLAKAGFSCGVVIPESFTSLESC